MAKRGSDEWKHRVGPKKKEPLARFWDKVEVRGPEDCWVWKGYPTEGGYGLFRMGGAQEPRIPAHRASWLLLKGEIPEGMLVLHSCDNPPCVNPKHLFIGTYQDNMDDKHQKGRAVYLKGSEVPGSKLNEEQVVCIMARLLKGDESRQQIASSFGVSRRLVGMIWLLDRWSHLFLGREVSSDSS